MVYKVVTPATSEPVTLQEAKLHCKIITDVLDVEEYAEDSLFRTWITTAREEAEHHTGRSFVTQTLEMALPAFPGDFFDLDLSPVASVTSIKYTDLNGVEQTVSPSLYSLSSYGNARRVSLTYGSEWPSTRDEPEAVRVRYVTGYVTVPATAKSAILLGVQLQTDSLTPAERADIERARTSLLNRLTDYSR